MDRQALVQQIRAKQTFLCIGLDTDPEKIPSHLRCAKNPVLEFNRQIIAATHDLCVAYKINTAFYEAQGVRGWETLAETVKLIPDGILKIADAKRADIGNTSAMYAKAFFETLHFDAITVSPYMGKDALLPFLQYKNKWTIVLALTSNAGSRDFQLLNIVGSRKKKYPLYKAVLQTTRRWGTSNNMMFVVGATHPKALKEIRSVIPHHFLLVPGVGTQGGDIKKVCNSAINAHYGLLINVSRSIIYASGKKNFAEAARHVAQQCTERMRIYLETSK